jgi:hypothetical protein
MIWQAAHLQKLANALNGVTASQQHSRRRVDIVDVRDVVVANPS